MKQKILTMLAVIVSATCLNGIYTETVQAGAFPQYGCRAGFFPQGTRLCTTGWLGPDSFQNAEIYCQDRKGRVSDYNDWRYRRFRGDGTLAYTAGLGTWLGPRTGDNLALYANGQFSSLGNDFDGESSVFVSRYYTCSHDAL